VTPLDTWGRPHIALLGSLSDNSAPGPFIDKMPEKISGNSDKVTQDMIDALADEISLKEQRLRDTGKLPPLRDGALLLLVGLHLPLRYPSSINKIRPIGAMELPCERKMYMSPRARYPRPLDPKKARFAASYPPSPGLRPACCTRPSF
jgi:hypothetical protein